MRIIHLNYLKSAENNIGVINQLKDELFFVNKLNYNWDVEVLTFEKKENIKFIRQIPFYLRLRVLHQLYFNLILIKKSYFYDCILIRYDPLNIFFNLFFLFKSKNSQAYFILHTDEKKIIHFKYPNKFGLLLGKINLFFLKIYSRNVNGIISVTKDLLERNKIAPDIKTIEYPNGVNLYLNKISNKRFQKIKLVFLASNFFKWNGLNILLDSVYNSDFRNNYELHIIGKIGNLENNLYNGIKKKCKNVFFHGVKKRKELFKILNQMDVGIGGFFSKEDYLKTSSSLKVREYFSCGLGVYSGHYDEQIPSDFPFLKVGKPKIEDIIDFANYIRKYSRDSIRLRAKNFIDKELAVKNLYYQIKKIN